MELLGGAAEDAANEWARISRTFLGLLPCIEEVGSNWARRPVRMSQLHHAVTEAWIQIPLLRSVSAYGHVPLNFLWRHTTAWVDFRGQRSVKASKAHALGQLAPPGRLVAGDDAEECRKPARIAYYGQPGDPDAGFVVVYQERIGGDAEVVPLDSQTQEMRTVPAGQLSPANGWECPVWVAALPRPSANVLQQAEEEFVSRRRQLTEGTAAARAAAGEAAGRPAAANVGRRPGMRVGSGVRKTLLQRWAAAETLLGALQDLESARQLLDWMFEAQQFVEDQHCD